MTKNLLVVVFMLFCVSLFSFHQSENSVEGGVASTVNSTNRGECIGTKSNCPQIFEQKECINSFCAWISD